MGSEDELLTEEEEGEEGVTAAADAGGSSLVAEASKDGNEDRSEEEDEDDEEEEDEEDEEEEEEDEEGETYEEVAGGGNALPKRTAKAKAKAATKAKASKPASPKTTVAGNPKAMKGGAEPKAMKAAPVVQATAKTGCEEEDVINDATVDVLANVLSAPQLKKIRKKTLGKLADGLMADLSPSKMKAHNVVHRLKQRAVGRSTDRRAFALALLRKLLQ